MLPDKKAIKNGNRGIDLPWRSCLRPYEQVGVQRLAWTKARVCVCVCDTHAHTHHANGNKHIQRTRYNTWTHHTRIDSMTRACVPLSRELQKATTDSSHASILSRASLQDSKGRDKPRSVAGLVKGQGLVKGSGKSSPLHPYNPTAGHDEWQGGEGRGHRDYAITAGSAAWKEEAHGAGSGDGVQEESALEEAVVSD